MANFIIIGRFQLLYDEKKIINSFHLLTTEKNDNFYLWQFKLVHMDDVY